MKKIFFLLILLNFFACGDDESDRNPFLPNISVNFTVNLNLPEASELLIPGNNKVFTGADKGIRGVVIYFVGGETYRAFDLACPHVELQSCSTMVVENLFLVCPCDDERFQIINGLPENGNIDFPAREYLVTKNGSILTVRK